MPQYKMTCRKNLGGCGHVIEFTCLMSELKEKRPKSCPKCKKRKTLQSIFFTPSTQFYETLGHTADKNAEKISVDEKHHLTKQHNAYRKSDTKWIQGPNGRMMRVKNEE